MTAKLRTELQAYRAQSDWSTASMPFLSFAARPLVREAHPGVPSSSTPRLWSVAFGVCFTDVGRIFRPHQRFLSSDFVQHLSSTKPSTSTEANTEKKGNRVAQYICTPPLPFRSIG